METGYTEPDRAITAALVEQLLQDAGAPRDPAAWEWVRTGSSSLVVLAGDVAVRVARDSAAAGDLRRSRDLVASLPPLPFLLPIAPSPSLLAWQHSGLKKSGRSSVRASSNLKEPGREKNSDRFPFVFAARKGSRARN